MAASSLEIPLGWVVSFVSLPSEPDLSDLNAKLLQERRLLLPTFKDGRVELKRPLQLPKSYKLDDVEVMLESVTPSLILVPGQAFTKTGLRLGRGFGFYDRLLSQYADVPSWGICWSEQICAELPMETHDRSVAEIRVF